MHLVDRSLGVSVLTTLTLACLALASSVSAETMGVGACMDGVDTAKTSLTTEVYCGPASAVVVTDQTSKVIVKLGTCTRNLRGPGSFDLYLGKDKSGNGPWPLTLHLSKPTASAKPGLTMEWRFTQWTALSTLKLALTARGGSFSGTALVRTKGKTVDPKASIRGTFTCGR